MAATKTPKADRKSGSGHARAAGLVPVQLLLTPEERDRVRVAAALAGESMAAFARRTVTAAAEKNLEKSGRGS